ncbi:ABC transporter ATP-binding protein [Paenibacillus sp. URB8-2]|uniref:ABC transporter ATP-binding protein n=1 Tax=Paenibacillus sp. URB8-2 TaxID=2741301 RepID=UPI0015B93159|nr:ABC transporter ATP-binding protein [Paenibacillus sp. URB8-2]BCG57366.1 iron ABC transporter ATP-binding protein [Paenibacillus sp. URB8-2]
MSIELNAVSKSFGSFEAVRSIDLTIGEGEFVAILGPSGCGKTTLLRMLAGFEQPTSGQILIDGRVVAGSGVMVPPEKRRVGMVFQSFALWPHMNVAEHIRFPIRAHKETPEHIKRNERERVEQVLDLAGLAPLASRMPHELSGGQKQRVSIARAIASEPSLLLMDEPLSSLDAMLRMDMRREIQHVHRRTSSSIVYVTHDQGEALAMADRIIVMKDGKIEQVGTPSEVYLHPQTIFVAKFVSKANLVKGRWINNRFIPENSINTSWSGEGAGSSFKLNRIYPVRPDQFLISQESQAGISGEIVNIQFQGREFHYHIRSGSDHLEVISSLPFRLYDKVTLSLKQQVG